MKQTVKKGRHYHSNLWQHLLFLNFRKKVKKTIVLGNAWYAQKEVAKSGVNKLFGFGGLFHHKNSARFGYQPDFNREGWILIYAYWYKDGEKHQEVICTVKEGWAFDYELYKNGKNIVWAMNGDIKKVVSHPKLQTWKRLQHYFGGKSVAPQNITAKFYKSLKKQYIN